MEWDVFISHASEDKETFVRPLATELVRQGLRVWYDEHTLYVGDSLRREIERGLSGSSFGIVVLSPNFFLKEWPQKELDYLVSAETDQITKRILPVWHNVDINEVRKRHPLLADRIAVRSTNGLEPVVLALLDSIKKHGTIIRSCSTGNKSEIKSKLPKNIAGKLYDLLVKNKEVEQNISLNQKHILVVDDELGICKLLKRALAQKGAIVRCSHDGAEAIDILVENFNYDMIITDVKMPKVSGIELLNFSNSRWPSLPVIVMTAYSTIEAEIESFGCTAFIPKPFDFKELLESVTDILNNNSLYPFLKNLFTDFQPTYRILSKCRYIVQRFLKNYHSNDLFETAFRHKIKEAIHKFNETVVIGGQAYEKAKSLKVRIERFENLMQKVKYGSRVGFLSVLNGIKEDLKKERPSIEVSVSGIEHIPDRLSRSELGTLLAFCCFEFVDNALDAITEKGQIRIVLYEKKTESAILLSVWNDGPVIASNIASSIFKEGVTTKGEGRGMGLSIIDRLSQRFGGKVTFDQIDGVRFSVVVPLKTR